MKRQFATNSEKIWKIQKKSKLNSEKIGKLWKISVLVMNTPQKTSSSRLPLLLLSALPLFLLFLLFLLIIPPPPPSIHLYTLFFRIEKNHPGIVFCQRLCKQRSNLPFHSFDSQVIQQIDYLEYYTTQCIFENTRKNGCVFIEINNVIMKIKWRGRDRQSVKGLVHRK